jgi:hypothetical protein
MADHLGAWFGGQEAAGPPIIRLTMALRRLHRAAHRRKLSYRAEAEAGILETSLSPRIGGCMKVAVLLAFLMVCYSADASAQQRECGSSRLPSDPNTGECGKNTWLTKVSNEESR